MTAGDVARRATWPFRLRTTINELRRRQDELDADSARVGAAVGEVEGLRARLQDTEPPGTPGRSDDLAGLVEWRVDHAVLHADALATQLRADFDRQLAELRSSVRLAQSLADNRPADRSAAADSQPSPAPLAAGRSFRNPTPGFDLLYRAFEDRHRGTIDEVKQRQEHDYVDLLEALPHADLPVADVGCGRGELVRLLTRVGIDALGVDANAGQLADEPNELSDRLVRQDLFEWLDARPDGSCRALVALHVIEHLPTDLQVRLLFEGRRVVAPGGALIVETPNALSLATAATNFWVDPTHERPVHPLFLEFLAVEAGFVDIELQPLHRIDLSFRDRAVAPDLVADLESLLLGFGDIALIARR